MRYSVAPVVMKEFMDHPGSVIHFSQLEAACKPGTPKGSIQEVVNRKIREGMPIEVVVRGNAWRYMPNKRASKEGRRMFEELAESKQGYLILECEDGTLWKAIEL